MSKPILPLSEGPSPSRRRLVPGPATRGSVPAPMLCRRGEGEDTDDLQIVVGIRAWL